LASLVDIAQVAVLRLARAEEVRHVAAKNQVTCLLLLRRDVERLERKAGDDDGRGQGDGQCSAHVADSPLDLNREAHDAIGASAGRRTGRLPPAGKSTRFRRVRYTECFPPSPARLSDGFGGQARPRAKATHVRKWRNWQTR